jgi:hypothetical protein
MLAGVRRREEVSAMADRRKVRTPAEMKRLREAIVELLAADNPMTVRQVFYRLVGLGLVEKTDNGYNNTVCKQLVKMREDGTVPFGYIADNTRRVLKPATYSSVGERLEAMIHNYRRAVWDDQPDYVEIWVEKDALAGVLYGVTAQWDVPLVSTRGFDSITSLYDAAQRIKAQNEKGKKVFLYYFGDYDGHGVMIDPTIVETLGRERYAPGANFVLARVAVLKEHIEQLNLPTRPPKGNAMSKGAAYIERCVEVDAIPPATLRGMVRDCIHRHLDREKHASLLAVEAEEREALVELARRFNEQ